MIRTVKKRVARNNEDKKTKEFKFSAMMIRAACGDKKNNHFGFANGSLLSLLFQFGEDLKAHGARGESTAVLCIMRDIGNALLGMKGLVTHPIVLLDQVREFVINTTPLAQGVIAKLRDNFINYDYKASAAYMVCEVYRRQIAIVGETMKHLEPLIRCKAVAELVCSYMDTHYVLDPLVVEGLPVAKGNFDRLNGRAVDTVNLPLWHMVKLVAPRTKKEDEERLAMALQLAEDDKDNKNDKGNGGA